MKKLFALTFLGVISSTNAATVATLDTRLKTAETTITGLKKTATALTTGLKTQTTAVTSHTSAIASIVKVNAAQNTSLTSLLSANKTQASKISMISADLANLNGQIYTFATNNSVTDSINQIYAYVYSHTSEAENRMFTNINDSENRINTKINEIESKQSNFVSYENLNNELTARGLAQKNYYEVCSPENAKGMYQNYGDFYSMSGEYSIHTYVTNQSAYEPEGYFAISMTISKNGVDYRVNTTDGSPISVSAATCQIVDALVVTAPISVVADSDRPDYNFPAASWTELVSTYLPESAASVKELPDSATQKMATFNVKYRIQAKLTNDFHTLTIDSFNELNNLNNYNIKGWQVVDSFLLHGATQSFNR